MNQQSIKNALTSQIRGDNDIFAAMILLESGVAVSCEKTGKYKFSVEGLRKHRCVRHYKQLIKERDELPR